MLRTRASGSCAICEGGLLVCSVTGTRMNPCWQEPQVEGGEWPPLGGSVTLPSVLGTLWGPLGTRMVPAAQEAQLGRTGHPLGFGPRPVPDDFQTCGNLAPGCRASLGAWWRDNQITIIPRTEACALPRAGGWGGHGGRTCLSQSCGHYSLGHPDEPCMPPPPPALCSHPGLAPWQAG